MITILTVMVTAVTALSGVGPGSRPQIQAYTYLHPSGPLVRTADTYMRSDEP